MLFSKGRHLFPYSLCTISILFLYSITLSGSDNFKKKIKTFPHPSADFLRAKNELSSNFLTQFVTSYGHVTHEGTCTITYACTENQSPIKIYIKGLNLCKMSSDEKTKEINLTHSIENFSDTITIQPGETCMIPYITSHTLPTDLLSNKEQKQEIIYKKEMLLWQPILVWSIEDEIHSFDLSNIYHISSMMRIHIDTDVVKNIKLYGICYKEMLPSNDKNTINGREKHFVKILETFPLYKDYLLKNYARDFIKKEILDTLDTQ